MKEKDKSKVKLSEKISLKFRKKFLVNTTKTFLIIAILIAAYIALNLGIQQVDLPKIDVTENKIYTLTDASKDAISGIDQDVQIYAYGFEEDSSLIDLLKQYHKANEKISYQVLTEESNYELVQSYGLKEGYYEVIIHSGEAEKIIDASTEFSTYDYTTYQSVDTTEQVLTNSILAVTEKNKPKIYFVEGHGEFSLSSDLGVLSAYLENEAYETETINLVSTNEIPEDCDILAIMSPTTDFFESEVQAIKNYINKGGEIYFSMDTVSKETSLPNIQTILDEYGVSVQNGYILEAGNNAVSKYPYIFIPEMSSTHKITSDLYSDKGSIYLMYSARLNFVSDEELTNLGVEKEILLNSSENSSFVTDLSSDINTAKETAETGACDIAAVMTKTINTENSEGESEDLTSKLVIISSGSFITDYTSPISDYPLSYIKNNKDFVINSMAFLGDKGNTLTIRKDMASSTYLPTDTQNLVVLAIVFGVPVLIIIIGIVVWHNRKKRK